MEQDKITTDRMDQYLRATFEILKERGGSARPYEVLAEVERRVPPTDFERTRTNSGAVRWSTWIRYFTMYSAKAGFLRKANGTWTLTEAGAEALKLPPGQLARTAIREHNQARRIPDSESKTVEDIELVNPESAQRQSVYEEAIEAAESEIEDYLKKMDPYDFQKLVGALLTAMGYFVRRIADPGPDGGVDLEVYKDPLGSSSPRIKVQVKHRDSKVNAKEARELEGLLRRGDDMGLFVSLAGYTSEAIREFRSSTKHIETIDSERLLELWKRYYGQLTEAGKALLPLTPVYFLTPLDD